MSVKALAPVPPPHLTGLWWELLLLYASLVGSCVGSFVGLVVSRLPHQQSVVTPRSHCDGCKRTLSWYELVPVLSYVWLGGRSRCCQQPLGARMVWLELLLGGLAAALLSHFGGLWPSLGWLPLCGALLAIALLDVDHWWVPDAISLPAMAWALTLALCPLGIGGGQALLGLLPALGLWLFSQAYLRLAGHEGMGLGDSKILAISGLALGAWPAVAVLVLACLQGAVVGTAVLLLGGHVGSTANDAAVPAALADDDWVPPPTAVPFGPFLVLATFEVLFLSPLLEDLGLWPATLASLAFN